MVRMKMRWGSFSTCLSFSLSCSVEQEQQQDDDDQCIPSQEAVCCVEMQQLQCSTSQWMRVSSFASFPPAAGETRKKGRRRVRLEAGERKRANGETHTTYTTRQTPPDPDSHHIHTAEWCCCLLILCSAFWRTAKQRREKDSASSSLQTLCEHIFSPSLSFFASHTKASLVVSTSFLTRRGSTPHTFSWRFFFSHKNQGSGSEAVSRWCNNSLTLIRLQLQTVLPFIPSPLLFFTSSGSTQSNNWKDNEEMWERVFAQVLFVHHTNEEASSRNLSEWKSLLFDKKEISFSKSFILSLHLRLFWLWDPGFLIVTLSPSHYLPVNSWCWTTISNSLLSNSCA